MCAGGCTVFPWPSRLGYAKDVEKTYFRGVSSCSYLGLVWCREEKKKNKIICLSFHRIEKDKSTAKKTTQTNIKSVCVFVCRFGTSFLN
jgi:hypothetical protein